MSAPDLFKWLQAVIDSGSGVERPEVDDKVFKMTYEFQGEIENVAGDDDEDEDEDVNNLLFPTDGDQ